MAFGGIDLEKILCTGVQITLFATTDKDKHWGEFV